jgi:hypothetical protein
MRDNSGGRDLILVLLPDFLGCLGKAQVFKKLPQTALHRLRSGFLRKMHKPNTALLNGPGIPVLVGHVRQYQLRNACHKGIHRRPGPTMMDYGRTSWH